MANLYTVSYGCAEWQEYEDFRNTAKAFSRFEYLKQNRPNMGLYGAEFLIIEKNGNTIDSYFWNEGEEDD